MSEGRVYVIGHRNPDTDSIASAMALARLKSELGMKNVIAARAGDLNPQTTFILGRLGLPAPVFVPDVHPRARDIMAEKVFTVSSHTPLIRVMELMERERVRFVPVVDIDGRPEGVITLMALSRMFMAITGAGPQRVVRASTRNIRDALGGTSLLDLTGGEVRDLSIFVGAMTRKSFQGTIKREDPRRCVVIVGDREDIQREAVDMGTALLIVSGGFGVSDEVLEKARQRGVSIIMSPFDTAATAQVARLSAPASIICDNAFESVSPDERVEDMRYRLKRVTGLMVAGKDGVLRGVVTRSSLLKPSPVSLILVDHNELSQAVEGAESVEVLGVVDHHRIGGFKSPRPIPFVTGPVGSTSTLVAELYEAEGVKMDAKIAGLLLGAVLSDTVMLRSPTTTERDRRVVERLERTSGLEHMAFGEEIFRATSSIRKQGAGAAVRGDHKVFKADGRSFGIGQVETIGFGEFHEEKDNLRQELEKIREEKGLSLSALLVTDIVRGDSLFLAVGEAEVLYNLGYEELEPGLYELHGVISRKKQVAPHILHVFEGLYQDRK